MLKQPEEMCVKEISLAPLFPSYKAVKSTDSSLPKNKIKKKKMLKAIK